MEQMVESVMQGNSALETRAMCAETAVAGSHAATVKAEGRLAEAMKRVCALPITFQQLVMPRFDGVHDAHSPRRII